MQYQLLLLLLPELLNYIRWFRMEVSKNKIHSELYAAGWEGGIGTEIYSTGQNVFLRDTRNPNSVFPNYSRWFIYLSVCSSARIGSPTKIGNPFITKPSCKSICLLSPVWLFLVCNSNVLQEVIIISVITISINTKLTGIDINNDPLIQ